MTKKFKLKAGIDKNVPPRIVNKKDILLFIDITKHHEDINMTSVFKSIRAITTLGGYSFRYFIAANFTNSTRFCITSGLSKKSFKPIYTKKNKQNQWLKILGVLFKQVFGKDYDAINLSTNFQHFRKHYLAEVKARRQKRQAIAEARKKKQRAIIKARKKKQEAKRKRDRKKLKRVLDDMDLEDCKKQAKTELAVLNK